MVKFHTLGVDQGIANWGYAVIEFKVYKDGRIKQTLKAHKHIKTGSGLYMGTRLLIVEDEITTVIKKYKPKIMGCERLFFSPPKPGGRNRSAAMMQANFATGILYKLSGSAGIYLKQFTPGTIKKQVTGYGRSSKEDVIEAIVEKLKIADKEITDHEADAMGIGIAVGIIYIEEQIEIDKISEKIKQRKNIK